MTELLLLVYIVLLMLTIFMLVADCVYILAILDEMQHAQSIEGRLGDRTKKLHPTHILIHNRLKPYPHIPEVECGRYTVKGYLIEKLHLRRFLE